MVALIQSLIDGIANLSPLVTINPDERGVRVHFGKVRAVLKPGIYWRCPIIHQIESISVVERPAEMNTQSLTTADGISVAISGRVKYRIDRPAVALYRVLDVDDSLVEECEAALASAVMDREWHDIAYNELEGEVESAISDNLLSWGVDVISFKITNMVSCRTIRLMQE